MTFSPWSAGVPPLVARRGQRCEYPGSEPMWAASAGDLPPSRVTAIGIELTSAVGIQSPPRETAPMLEVAEALAEVLEHGSR